jgi:DNA repair protein RadC
VASTSPDRTADAQASADPHRTQSSRFPGARSLSEIPARLRPLDKLLARGPAALTVVELLALVLAPASRGRSSIEVAHDLVRRHGLLALAERDTRALTAERGLGPAGASRLRAAFELGRRAVEPLPPDRPRVTRPGLAWPHVRHLGRARKEHLVGLYLDAQNGLIHRETVSVGSLNTTRTHPREILYPAVEHLALGFVLAHNHPSGCLDPSPEDVEFTRAVHRAGELMGIELYDHLIVAGTRYVSMRERGLL